MLEFETTGLSTKWLALTGDIFVIITSKILCSLFRTLFEKIHSRYNGRYGYTNGWSVPLVQSLGVEGNGGTLVNVPLNSHELGKISVDNGYGVSAPYFFFSSYHLTHIITGLTIPFSSLRSGSALHFILPSVSLCVHTFKSAFKLSSHLIFGLPFCLIPSTCSFY